MGNKIHTNLFRLGIINGWNSRWFASKRDFVAYLKQDSEIRAFILKALPKSGVSKVDIERSPKLLNVIIHTSKAGMIIGRGGSGVENLKKNLKKVIGKDIDLRLTIEEVKKPQQDASIVADNMVEQVEKRVPFRRVLKQTLEQVSQNTEVKGVKVALSGRLDGAEMSRSEYLIKGKIPLATLRANIDFSKKTAHTKYGTIGIKVWIYKGDILHHKVNTALGA